MPDARKTLIVFNADAVDNDLAVVALLAAHDPDDDTPVDLAADYAAVVLLAADEPSPQLPDAVALDAACRCPTCRRRRQSVDR